MKKLFSNYFKFVPELSIVLIISLWIIALVYVGVNAVRSQYLESPAETYIIKWCAVSTKTTGNGTIGFSKDEAEAIARKLNIKHNELIHWIEKYPQNYLGRK